MRKSLMMSTALVISASANASVGFSTDWDSLIASRGSYVVQTALPAPSTESWFGSATAMWHDDATGTQWAVVGAPEEDSLAGAVYVFSLAPGAEWHLETRLVAPDGAPADEFGYAVAIDGNTIAIGAPDHVADFFDGAVYMFVRDPMTSTWTQQGEALSATAGEFGYSMALRGDALAVGDPECDCVHTYTRSASTWSPETNISAPADLSFSAFGLSLAMTDNTLLVGAPFDTAVLVNQGSAVLYSRSRDGWDQQQILRPEIDTSASQYFGYAVAVSDDAIVIGAPAQTAYRGAVHTFVYDTATSEWQEQSLLRDTTGATKPLFGTSAAMANGLLAIGAPSSDGNGSAAIYRSHDGAWTLDSVLKGDDGSSFGYSIAAAGGQVLVGAPTSGDVRQGAAYVFISDRIFADGIE